MADGNSTQVATEKEDSALTKLMKSLEGQKKPNASDVKAITEKFKKSAAKRAQLVKALEEFDNQEAPDLATDMVRCYGRKHLEIDGVRYVPTSRGERVYYKRMGDKQEVEKL